MYSLLSLIMIVLLCRLNCLDYITVVLNYRTGWPPVSLAHRARADIVPQGSDDILKVHIFDKKYK